MILVPVHLYPYSGMAMKAAALIPILSAGAICRHSAKFA
jgi:hypothetical protein